jgi:hypothetical protein
MTFYVLQWSQPYTTWEPMELPIVDFTQAHELLTRIMSK